MSSSSSLSSFEYFLPKPRVATPVTMLRAPHPDMLEAAQRSMVYELPSPPAPILRKRYNSQTRLGVDNLSTMLQYLYHKCLSAKWFQEFPDENGYTPDESCLGLALRKSDGTYLTEPLMDPLLLHLFSNLGAAAALTMSSQFTEAFLVQLHPSDTIVTIGSSMVVPIFPSLEILLDNVGQVARDTMVCFLKEERIALIWHETNGEDLLAFASLVEERIMEYIWGSRFSSIKNFSKPSVQSKASSISGPYTPSVQMWDEKQAIIQTAIEREELGADAYNAEEAGAVPRRPFLLYHAVTIGIAMVLVVFVEMLCISKLISEFRYDNLMLRFAFVGTIPVFALFSLFFFIVISGSVFQILGPLKWVRGNSMYYSAKAPQKERYRDIELPHITIQMPVYKEGLASVIIPTVTSLMVAIKTYEAQGGTASIYVNDDGMQLVDADLAEARATYYEVNGIGWCSRPKDTYHKKKNPTGFHRAGQFKKASNMNYCLDFSIRVEDELLRLVAEKAVEKGCEVSELTIEEEDELSNIARETVIAQDEGKTLAGGNVRIGEVILLIDSDTRVPEDCLLYGALEMYESPEVGILQHASGVMQVAHNAFENGITYFTNLIYMSIMFAVGNGDCAPFVGHNAFLRWKAVQAVSFEKDGKRKFWSDDHVSEDFDISLRMQMNKFIVRLATYHDGGFKEGVSLTVYDELARWEKYAYGCNELVFNPIIKWHKGPFTKLFMRFLWSDIKITSKVTIIAYIGTYYAIAAAVPLTLANYLLVGWFNDDIDQFYLTSWKIFVGMAVVFNVLSPIAFAMLRHRLGSKIFFWSVVETIKWTPMFVLFFGGISIHLFAALFCHFFSIKLTWTATAKEVEKQGLRVGLDKIFKDFKYMYAFMVPVIGAMVYFGLYAPRGFLITDFSAILPLANQVACHALLPFALGLV